MILRMTDGLKWGWAGLWLGLATTAVFLFLFPSWQAEVWQPILAGDLNQHRINIASPIPQGQFHLQQTFQPWRNGLTEIEVTLVKYETAAAQNGRFSLHLYDANNTLIAEQEWATETLEHNQKVQLRFPPQPTSAQQTYRLTIDGDGNNQFAVWGYDLDVYENGRFSLAPKPLTATLPTSPLADIQFATRYQLGWRDSSIMLAETLYYEGTLLLVALLVLFMPGCLLLLLGFQQRPLTHNVVAWWGTALALSLAVWPLLWFGLTLLGGRWWGWLLWAVVISGWVMVIWLWRRQPRPVWRFDAAQGWFLLLLFVGFAVRLLAVRDLGFPPWVDSSRHGLITAVLTELGQTPTDYGSFLNIGRFPYHFGFHTLASSLHLLTDWPLPRLLLILGQLLNSLTPLTIFAAAWLLWRRSSAALLASFLVALPFFFPAYYATWGRLTQLTAVLLLPVLLALTWNLLDKAENGRSTWWLVALLAAGLFLIHFRVFVFYLPFAAIATFVRLPRLWQNGRWLLAAGLLGGLLVAPRAIELLRVTENPVATLRYTLPNYNAFPTSYLRVGWESEILWLTAVFLLATILIALGQPRQHSHRSTTLPITLVAWVAILFILLAGERLGLPETTLVNINSLYITLFVPLALFLGGSFGQLWGWLAGRHWLGRQVSLLLLGIALLPTTLFGIRQQITIINPQTILAQPADLAAIDWIRQHLPADAHIAVNSWRWLGNTWAGSDGGAWLLPLTGHSTTTPPVDYIYNFELRERVNGLNEAITAVSDWADPAQIDWLAQQGVTHIFVGTRGGIFDPATLVQNPQLDAVYSQNGVFVFKIRGATGK